jgi:hypothetical protein
MNLKDAENVGYLARQIRDLDRELIWLDEQDGAAFPSQRIIRGAMLEIGILPSIEAAQAARALLRRDYLNTRKQLVEQLHANGVEVGEFSH